MKIIKYKFLSYQINHGTEEKPEYEDVIADKEIRCAESYLESNLEIARKESYNGEEPVVEDDGQPEPEVQPTPEERIAELESMLNALLGVTE
jgi:hypothetical protein